MRMSRMLLNLFLAGCLAPNFIAAVSEQEEVLYHNDFEQAKPGVIPKEFLVLIGDFTVTELNGEKVLELPGAPLDSFGLLFGPSARENVAASARIHGTATGRRFPAFGVGLNGVGGFRLQVSPAKRAVEIIQRDIALAQAPYDWESGQWTHLFLQVRATGENAWKVEGKVWGGNQGEPEEWTLKIEVNERPINGRASIWGNPFSGTPIHYDDLLMKRIND
jgi:hypothetical protein